MRTPIHENSEDLYPNELHPSPRFRAPQRDRWEVSLGYICPANLCQQSIPGRWQLHRFDSCFANWIALIELHDLSIDLGPAAS